MIALPDLLEPPVIPEALPELVTVQCACLTGILDYGVTASGELLPVVCKKCDGRGELEVCSKCGEVQAVDTDVCGCTSYPKPVGKCETYRDCSNPAEIDGLCRGHFLEGLAKYREDMPPELFAEEWQHAKTASWL